MPKGERQEYTGYKVTSKKNGQIYEVGNGVKRGKRITYEVTISNPESKKKHKYRLPENYIRDRIKEFNESE